MGKVKSYFKYFLILIMSLIFFSANAQCDPFFDPFCEDVDVPLDDYVVPLVALSAIFGAWIIMKKGKNVQKT